MYHAFVPSDFFFPISHVIVVDVDTEPTKNEIEELPRVEAETNTAEALTEADRAQLESVFQGLPTNLIMKHETTEISFAFVGFGSLLAGLAFLLGKAWRPLP